jgi:hypothetical protein
VLPSCATRGGPARRQPVELLRSDAVFISLLLAAAVVVAVIAVARRRLRRRALRRAARERAGGTAGSAIAVRSFTEIDEHLGRLWCHCGGYLERSGEGTRDADGRRFRIARLRCQECDEPTEMFFDTTDVLH